MEDIVGRMKNMTFKCDVCGRELKKKNKLKGYTLCPKHMHQLMKHGKFLDKNPRTEKDLNDFIVVDDTAIFNVYDIKAYKIGEFVIDAEDVRKIRYHKWRMDSNGRIITGNSTSKNPKRELSRFLLDITDENIVVDHKDGNPKNNRKSNLRVCTFQENKKNISYMPNNTSGWIGVLWDKQRKKWAPEIRNEYNRWHLGRYTTLEEAVYARFCAEEMLYGEFRNTNKDTERFEMFRMINESRKNEIKNYVLSKINNG